MEEGNFFIGLGILNCILFFFMVLKAAFHFKYMKRIYNSELVNVNSAIELIILGTGFSKTHLLLELLFPIYPSKKQNGYDTLASRIKTFCIAIYITLFTMVLYSIFFI